MVRPDTRSTCTASARPATTSPRKEVDTQMVTQQTGVHTMSEYRIRLVKRDGGRTRPVDVHLDPEMKNGELRRHLIGMIRDHTIEDYPDRNARHYTLEVLKQRTDDVLHVYRTGG